jgi:hypothetical protein
MTNPRRVTCELLEWLEEGIIDPTELAKMCLNYMSEADVADMAHVNDLSLSLWSCQDEDDGQPDEAQEWYDFDPEC